MGGQRKSPLKVLPSASRLVSSMRDLGYDCPQAVADLVDNSIAAGATRVEIALGFQGAEAFLCVVDNGEGMSAAKITEAMRYGTRQSYGEEALGKFGLGLKTASLSQCRRLTIASRTSRSAVRIEVRELDLDHILARDRWEIFDVPASAADERLVVPLRRGVGTVVLWEMLDRVLGYKLPSGKHARNGLADLAEQLEQHLGMIFHRFLAGEVPGQKRVTMTVNDRTVKPWDPFARCETATMSLPAFDIDVRTNDSVGIVHVQPFVLPPKEKFSSEEAFHWYGGPRKWNAQQGFYIYRANRMIQCGGWCRMRTVDEHLKLARAAIDFYPELDTAFEINVAKVRAMIPVDLRERLRGPIEKLTRAAQAAYRTNAQLERGPSTRLRRDGPMDATVVRGALERAASAANEKAALRRIAGKLRTHDPHIAKELGW